MTIDIDSDRLFVACPVAGQVLVVNLNTYKIEQTIQAFPGVRIVELDKERKWMLLAGFVPYIEIRSMDDYALVNRFSCPHWARWIDIDSAGNTAYVTSEMKYGPWTYRPQMILR